MRGARVRGQGRRFGGDRDVEARGRDGGVPRQPVPEGRGDARIGLALLSDGRARVRGGVRGVRGVGRVPPTDRGAVEGAGAGVRGRRGGGRGGGFARGVGGGETRATGCE